MKIQCLATEMKECLWMSHTEVSLKPRWIPSPSTGFSNECVYHSIEFHTQQMFNKFVKAPNTPTACHYWLRKWIRNKLLFLLGILQDSSNYSKCKSGFLFFFLLERLFKYSRKLNIVLKFKVMFQYDVEKVFYRVVRVSKLSVFIKSNYFRF